jgi:inorganic triphosphatase YgiF
MVLRSVLLEGGSMLLEVESKYAASEDQIKSLLEVDALGEYSLKDAEEQHLTDHYMDTADGDILKGGYACRIREKNGQRVLTLKGLGGADGAIHQREEYEMAVQFDMQQQWPNDSIRDLLISLSCSKTLSELFTIRQYRILRKVYHSRRLVGEMSLDAVDMITPSGQTSGGYEVEIELDENGTLDDLRALDKIMRDYGLRPEPRSKFDRAMAYIRENP